MFICLTAQSCSELVDRGLHDNLANVELDPDSTGKEKPFWATCDVVSNDGVGVTIIRTYNVSGLP